MKILLPLANALSNTLRRSVFARATLFGLSLPVGLFIFAYFSKVQPDTDSVAKKSRRGSSQWLRAEHENEGKEKEMGEEFREGEKRREWFYQQRAYPLTEIPQTARLEAFEQWAETERVQNLLRKRGKLAAVPEQEIAWAALGPRPVLNGQVFGTRSELDAKLAVRTAVSGRVTAIALDPRYNGTTNQTVYVGGAQGGLWRSLDNGQNWTPLTDSLPSLAIGAVAIDPTNPDVIYLGTGEPNRSGDSYYGAGLFKTTNGGQSWTQITGPTSTTDPKLPVFLNCTFSRIAIDPSKPSTVFVATNTGFFLSAATTPGPAPLGNRGLWKTTDGGLTWINVNPTVSKLDRLASDVVIDPRNPKVVYTGITSEGIFRSETGGDLLSWKYLNKGLPARTDNKGNDNYERIVLTIGPPIGTSTASTVYAAFAGVDDKLLGIYRSTDQGENWAAVTRPQAAGQANYNLALMADPTNGNILYYGTQANDAYDGGTVYRSLDAGRSWEDLSVDVDIQDGINTLPQPIGLHPDTHCFAISPANSNILFTGNDGGIWRTDSAKTNVWRWNNLNTNLNITQFQSVAVHPYDPNLVIGGTQDNGTNLHYGAPAWTHIDDGDGGAVLIDQSNPSVIYHTFYNIKSQGNGAVIGPVVSLDGGQTWIERGCFGCVEAVSGDLNPNDRVAFYAPMTLNTGYSGANGNAIYFGTYRVYRSIDQGRNWMGLGGGVDGYGADLTKGQGVITTLAAFPSRGGIDAVGEVVWTGSSDGMIYVTQNAHEIAKTRFRNVTRAPLPNRFVTDIALDVRNVQRAVATFSGFNRATSNTPGHVFLTENFGASWTDISGNLPDVPVNSAVLDPTRPATIFVGTDIGVFQSTDNGRTWVRLGNNFPSVSVLQMRYHQPSGSLIAATHGRGVYRLTLNPRPLSTVSAASFGGAGLAGEAIVTSFGVDLATKSESANKVPLPTTLAGTRVYVRDAFGTERIAPLFFVSPNQVNFQVPAGSVPGQATITILDSDGKASVGYATLNFVSPSLFTANANGSGPPTGAVYRVRADGSTSIEPLTQAQGSTNAAAPIDVSNPNEQVYLVLFGTGFRYRSALSAATVTFSPVTANAFPPVNGSVSFVGKQGALVGLDQLNARVPATLAGRGEVNLGFNVDGRQANTVRVNFK